MASAYIDAEQLSAISASIKTKGEIILSAYRSDTMSALQLGRECLQINGVNLENLFKSLEDIYVKINGRLSELADFLKNNVASSYEELAQALQVNFNGEVGETISSLLGIPLT